MSMVLINEKSNLSCYAHLSCVFWVILFWRPFVRSTGSHGSNSGSACGREQLDFGQAEGCWGRARSFHMGGVGADGSRCTFHMGKNRAVLCVLSVVCSWAVTPSEDAPL
jgi:hypothetical protein